MKISDFYGRLVPVVDSPSLPKDSRLLEFSALKVGQTKIICQRCQQRFAKKDVKLPNGQYYCPYCLQFGRLTSQAILYTIPEPNDFQLQAEPLTWSGKLSSLQQQCALTLKQKAAAKQDFLLWAVTGAGKTEIMFPTLQAAIKRKERICLAAPRIDVCNELYPRLQQAFAQTSICLLHHASPLKYNYSQLVICTTHQLIRFYQAFDLLIIDEADAFPFAGNQMLQTAVKQARKPNSSLLLLTATPNRLLLKKIKQKKLDFGYLPLRFHGHLLPEPQIMVLPHWQKKILQQQLDQRLLRKLKSWIDAQWPFLVFSPEISLLAPIKATLMKYFPAQKMATVFANDQQRIDKVLQMRNEQYQLLVTTTILERGVTFAKLNVIVLGADERVFKPESLVQIAGRAGRSLLRPTGEVIFVCSMLNQSSKKAVRQIKFLNYQGRKLMHEDLSALPAK